MASSPLGDRLRSARTIKGLSVRAVAADADVSPAYVSKLEAGKVDSPSPNVLHRLGEVLGLPYSSLMRLAGYVVPRASTPVQSTGLGTLLAGAELTDDEMMAVEAFVAHLRGRRPS